MPNLNSIPLLSALTSLSIFLTIKTSLEWISLIFAIYIALYIYFAWITLETKLFVKADNNGIEFKFGIRFSSKNYFIWDAVKNVRIGYAYIVIYKKSGRRNRVQLGWLPYGKVIEIKESLEGICRDKRIPCEKVDFIKYPKEKKDKKEK